MGSMPVAAKIMKPATSVSPIASSGERKAMAVERSGRRMSSMRMRALPGTAHQEPDLLTRDLACIARLRQVALRDHRHPVGNLEDLVEVLADHQHRGSGPGEV